MVEVLTTEMWMGSGLPVRVKVFVADTDLTPITTNPSLCLTECMHGCIQRASQGRISLRLCVRVCSPAATFAVRQESRAAFEAGRKNSLARGYETSSRQRDTASVPGRRFFL